MTLWDLLVGFSFVMPLSGALAAAHIDRASWLGCGAGIVLGLVLGAAFAWGAISATRFVRIRVAGRTDAAAERLYGLLYFGAAMWVIVGYISALLLGDLLFLVI